MKKIWVTWEVQRRNQTLSSALGAELFELDYDNCGSSSTRYLKSIMATVKIILKERPAILFVQNPSIILATLAVVISKLTKINVVIDAHNGAIEPIEEGPMFRSAWAKWLLKMAPSTIVTNEALKVQITSFSDRKTLVLPDPIPSIPKPNQVKLLAGQRNILFVCSWAEDEPYEEVIKAASLLDESIYVYISGNYNKVGTIGSRALPSNVVLTGFISTEEFDCFLHSVDVVMDLTTRESCLICGAYEAISVEKPLILSGTEALRQYFPGMIYTENTSHGLAKSINYAVDNLEIYKDSSKNLRKKLLLDWQTTLSQVEFSLGIRKESA